MNPWKISTIVLAVLLLAGAALYFRQPPIADSPDLDESGRSEIATLREAVNDTQAFLNWYRINQEDGLTTENYESNLNILRNRYIHHFPEWARDSP